MPKISLIAAIDEQRGLGKNNRLLCHLPKDLKHFKSLTLGKPIIMGRNTFQSIGKPLPGRQNIVLTRQTTPIEGVVIANSLEQALESVSQTSEVMIIGGAKLFEQTLSLADTLYLTVIHHQFEADVFFPPFDKSHWIITDTTFHPKDENNAYDMTFYTYLQDDSFKKNNL